MINEKDEWRNIVYMTIGRLTERLLTASADCNTNSETDKIEDNKQCMEARRKRK